MNDTVLLRGKPKCLCEGLRNVKSLNLYTTFYPRHSSQKNFSSSGNPRSSTQTVRQLTSHLAELFAERVAINGPKKSKKIMWKHSYDVQIAGVLASFPRSVLSERAVADKAKTWTNKHYVWFLMLVFGMVKHPRSPACWANISNVICRITWSCFSPDWG